MNTWFIYTYGNQDILYNILMSTGSVFGQGIIASMVKLAGITTILVFLFNVLGVTIRGEVNRPLDVLFFIRFYIIYAVFTLIPAGKIVIHDEMYNTEKVVVSSSNNLIPLGVVSINSYMSQIMHGLINMYQRFFESDSVTYSKSGMAFGSNFIASLPTYNTGDTIFEHNLSSYFSNCGLPLLYSQGGLSDFESSADIMAFFAGYNTSVQKNRFVAQVNNNGNQYVTDCLQAITSLNSTWNSNSQKYQNNIASLAGFPNAAVTNFINASKITANDLLAITDSSQALKQAIAMNITYKSIYNTSAQVGNSALANAAYDAQQFQQYKIGGELSGEQAARIVPAIKNFFEALLFMLYPIIIFYALISSSFLPILKYIKICATINAIPLIYEILNSIIYWYAAKTTQGALSIANATNIYSLNANIVAVAGYLSMTTPALAYMLVSGGDMMFTSLISHSTDAGKQISTQSGSEMAKGNFSMGNTSLDNLSFANTQANKFNPVLDMTAGSPSMNRITSSGITSNIGGTEYEQAFKTTKTSMPVDLNFSQMATNQLSNSLTHSHAVAGSYSMQWTKTRDNLHQLQSSLTGTQMEQSTIGNQIDKDIRRSEALSANIQAGLGVFGTGGSISANEASNLANDIKQLKSISDKYTTNQDSSISDTFKQVNSLAQRSGKVITDTLNTTEAINKINSSGYGITTKMAGDFQDWVHKNLNKHTNDMTTDELRNAGTQYISDYIKNNFNIDKFSVTEVDKLKAEKLIKTDSNNYVSVINEKNIDTSMISKAQQNNASFKKIDSQVLNEFEQYSPSQELKGKIVRTTGVAADVINDVLERAKSKDNPDQAITEQTINYATDHKNLEK